MQRQGNIVGRSLIITPEALDALGQYSWPGNVRELENMLERVTYLTTKPVITVDDLPIEFHRPPDAVIQHTTALAEEKAEPVKAVSNSTVKVLKDHSMNAKAQAILQAWETSNGNVARAAALLGSGRTTLWRKMVKYELAKNGLSSK